MKFSTPFEQCAECKQRETETETEREGDLIQSYQASKSL